MTRRPAPPWPDCSEQLTSAAAILAAERGDVLRGAPGAERQLPHEALAVLIGLLGRDAGRPTQPLACAARQRARPLRMGAACACACDPKPAPLPASALCWTSSACDFLGAARYRLARNGAVSGATPRRLLCEHHLAHGAKVDRPRRCPGGP